jgi:APA family basic amino acid/polyamine antiporter
MAIAVIISRFGALTGWTMICAEMPLAAAKDGLFPERFKRLSGTGVPTFGVVNSTVLASVAVILGATHVIRLGPRWSRFAKA